jgi:hypothetical protein
MPVKRSGRLVPLPVRGNPCAAVAASAVGPGVIAPEVDVVAFVAEVGETLDDGVDVDVLVLVLVGADVDVLVLVGADVDVLVLDVLVLVDVLVELLVVVTSAPCSQCDTTRLPAVASLSELVAVAETSNALSCDSTWKWMLLFSVLMIVPETAPPGLNVAESDQPVFGST